MRAETQDEKPDGFLVYPIGYVHNRFDEPADPEQMRSEESTIVIDPQYSDGLYRIEEHRYLYVIFYFHRSSGYELIAKRRIGEIKGVFASRSPGRPVPIGLSKVELLRVDGTHLLVKGLDTLNGTPVLDIKPYFPKHTTEEQ